MLPQLALASRTSRRNCVSVLAVTLVCHIPFVDTYDRSFSNILKATPAATKKAPNARKRKPLSSPPDSYSATLASSSPTGDSNNETNTRPTKKLKVIKAKPTASRAKKPKISTPETEEDIINAKAIAAGRARYAADKLAAKIKKEDGEEEEEHPVADDAEGEDEWPVGMNVDSGEDEGLTAFELVKNEVFGEGVEI